MPTAVSTVTGGEVQYLIAKLDRAAPRLVYSSPAEVPIQDFSYPYATSNCNNATNAKTRQKHQAPPKHIKQLESLSQHIVLVHPSCREEPTTFCELGCGTAKLSDHLSELLSDKESSYVLIDRKVFGNTTRLRDGAIAARGPMQRITMDISDIENISATCESDSVVVISKHLCGPAADFCIQCCTPCYTPIAVATCCHYMCTWDTFSNTKFFETLGFTRRDFQVLTIISQWASMLKPSTESKETKAPIVLDDWLHLPALDPLPQTIHIDDLIDSKVFEKNFTRDEKAALGKRCKLMLDLARAYHLQELGYMVKVVRYTTMSMEDHLILATRNQRRQEIS